MSAEEQQSGFQKTDSDAGVMPTAEPEIESEQAAARMLLKDLDGEGEEEIFFGPVTDKEKVKSKKMRRKTEVFKPGFRVIWDGEKEEEEDGEEGMKEELKGEADEAEGSEEDSKPTKDQFTQHTPSPAQKKHRSSESVIDVNTPPFNLITVSPQADAVMISKNNSTCDGDELFSAIECISMAGCDSVAVETDKDGSSSNEKNIFPEGTGVGNLRDETEEVNQKQCIHVDSNVSDFSKVGSVVDTDDQSSMPNEQRGSIAVAEPTPCKTTGRAVIYSSPVLISTSVQKVQMQQPLCYGNSITHLPIPISNVNKMENLATESDFAHPVDSSLSQETAAAPSAFNPTGHSAFGKPIRMVDDMASSQNKGFTHLHHLPSASGSALLSPVLNGGYYNRSTDNLQGHCTLPSNMLHKENVNPDRQPNTVVIASDLASSCKVLSAVSSPVVSALCSKQPLQSGLVDAQQAPSPRVLQLSNQQTSAASPSDARQRMIDEKRALLARLRAEKQELRQRIKEDNEKCFNMKLENASALQSNMARGMTPVFDRLPSQGCDGPAALTLTERELELVTKLHTIRNSQHVSSDRIQSPCHQAIHHRDQSRLHWHQDLILSTDELSSPSHPRCTAKTILSKKGHNSIRRVNGLQPSSSASLHSGRPRAKQHLLF